MSAPSAFRSVIRKARKAHKCCECHAVINIGDRYQYSSGVWDGEPDDYKQCLGCGEIFDAVTRDGDEVGFTQLRDYLFDSDMDHPEQLLAFSKRMGVDADAVVRLMDLGVSS
ncbi:hypothetical protein C0J08_14635 [Marinomonas sp. CT5]|uniref:hypothetical protein n=1 Tax=Marinomonas sp. CT5 TaxID=2066133 RepID=UPI001BB0D323|nr:hypothetical protein [Marinomonas sp. CT5]QUX96557.1 hypothetical protein C0J08_14635 [Marinomonas sp. CT5]